MTKHRFLILCLAALTVLVLTACGDTTEVSSDPEGIETFGEIDDALDAELSNAAATTTAPDSPETSSGDSSGVVVEDNAQTSAAATETETTASASPSSSSSGGSSSGGSSTTTTTTSPSTSPTATASPEISPPAPASTATADEVEAYVGKSLSSLIADLGYPTSSDYEPIDEDDPDAGDIGTLFFDGFTVTTKRTSDGETITAVNRS